jgi:hypothetical protein
MYDVVLFSPEPAGNYNRTLLSQLLTVSLGGMTVSADGCPGRRICAYLR